MEPQPTTAPYQVRAKLATRDTDHCDPQDPKGKGCRYEPCAATKGLSKALQPLRVALHYSPYYNPLEQRHSPLESRYSPLE